MGCLITICALIAPRVTMFVILLSTDWFSRAYETTVYPVLGFIFLPYTTLVYMAAMLNAGGVMGIWTLLMVLAVLTDLGNYKIEYKRAL